MTERYEWTPLQGILSALRVLGFRLSFGFVVYTAIFYFSWPLLREIPFLTLLFVVFGLVGAGMGIPMGWVAANRLVERSGFTGVLLIGIAAGGIIVMYVLSYHLVVWVRGYTTYYGTMLAFCMTGGCLIGCTKTIMLD